MSLFYSSLRPVIRPIYRGMQEAKSCLVNKCGWCCETKLRINVTVVVLVSTILTARYKLLPCLQRQTFPILLTKLGVSALNALATLVSVVALLHLIKRYSLSWDHTQKQLKELTEARDTLQKCVAAHPAALSELQKQIDAHPAALNALQTELTKAQAHIAKLEQTGNKAHSIYTQIIKECTLAQDAHKLTLSHLKNAEKKIQKLKIKLAQRDLDSNMSEFDKANRLQQLQQLMQNKEMEHERTTNAECHKRIKALDQLIKTIKTSKDNINLLSNI